MRACFGTAGRGRCAAACWAPMAAADAVGAEAAVKHDVVNLQNEVASCREAVCAICKCLEETRVVDVFAAIWQELARHKTYLEELRVENAALRHSLEVAGLLRARDLDIAQHRSRFATISHRYPNPAPGATISAVLSLADAAVASHFALFLVGASLRCLAATASPCRRFASALESRVYAVGGLRLMEDVSVKSQSRRVLTSVERLDAAHGCWTPVASMPRPRLRAACAQWSGKLYLLGGLAADEVVLDTVDCFDMAREKWLSELSPMSAPRAACAATVCSDLLLVVGGSSNGRHLLASGLSFSLRSRHSSWASLPPMAATRSVCALLAAGGRACALGGLDARGSLGSCEILDPSLQDWQALPSMIQPRHDFAAVAIGSRIMVMGGYSASTQLLCSVESLQLGNDRWESLAPMLDPCAAGAAVVAGGQILVLGGTMGRSSKQQVQGYSLRSREWRLAPPLRERRMALSAATLSPPEEVVRDGACAAMRVVAAATSSRSSSLRGGRRCSRRSYATSASDDTETSPESGL